MPGVKTATQPLDLVAAEAALRDLDAAGAISWAASTFGRGLVLTTSFGAQSAVMLHLVTRIVPDIPVIWVDTGYNFKETYVFAEKLVERLKLNLHVYQSPLSPARMEATLGKLWEQGAEGLTLYDQLRKVEPMERALRELKVQAWLAGLRRDQTDFRRSLPRIEKRRDGLCKVYPILDWSTRDIHDYLTRHDLPYHPLYEQGYVSIGDWHSTSSIAEGEHERSGRFKGLKQECGIHLPQTAEESESRDSSGL